jgi:hypothetical protein
MDFSQFLLEAEEEERNIKAMLKKLPKKHADLMKGFKFKYVPGNTLKGDDEHIGLIKGKTVTVAGPWNYGREFTTLHEIGHMVWEKLMTPELKKAWTACAKKNKKQNQDNDEENFCMAYAACYTKHPPLTHHHEAWVDFIKNKVPK